MTPILASLDTIMCEIPCISAGHILPAQTALSYPVSMLYADIMHTTEAEYHKLPNYCKRNGLICIQECLPELNKFQDNDIEAFVNTAIIEQRLYRTLFERFETIIEPTLPTGANVILLRLNTTQYRILHDLFSHDGWNSKQIGLETYAVYKPINIY